ncbi:MAG TPA: hypothetical protein VK509_25295 [Polyangiales bacterium]|nr:hypothetical protein [Polyangiales bacterium]
MSTIEAKLPAALRLRARHAYELGRLAHGAQALWLALPMLLLGLAVSTRPLLSWAAGSALIALAVGLRWSGGAVGRAVVPALIAGLPPLVLPLCMRAGGHCCVNGMCWSLCMVGCIVGGVCAGAMVGLASTAEREQRGAFLLAATAIAGLAGVLGCTLAGSSGMAGMALAVLATSWPVAILARARV